jgi:hypothetical protein
MRHLARTVMLAAAAALSLAACGGSDSTTTASGGDGGGSPKLTITSPADCATVKAPFTLKWDSSVPLGPPDSGKDHVHVYLDGNDNDYTVVGGNSFRLTKVTPGEHEVEIALQHADHTPVGPESKITVTVSGSGGSGSPSPSSDGGDGGGYGY